MRNNTKLLRYLAEQKMLDEPTLSRELEANVYANTSEWRGFLRLLLISLGLGFLVCGIVFFLAYNWADMPKAAKISLAAAGVILPVLLALTPWFSGLLRNGLMTAGAFMVGSLFAVLGQIYQTGADEYDLFLAWWVFTLVWVIVVDFSWLWLLSLVLLNTTLVLYAEQVAFYWSSGTVCMVLLLVNLVAFIGFSYVGERYRKEAYPRSFLLILALATAGFAVIGFIAELFDPSHDWFAETLLVLVPILLASCGYLAYLRRELAYLVIVAISSISISTSFVISLFDDVGAFFLGSIWVLAATVFCSFQLNKIRKIWRHDK